MSGMTHYGQRRGTVVTVALFSRGGWPTAERAARSLIRPGETLVRWQYRHGVYYFTVESD